MVKTLISEGADVDTVDGDGRTALHTAAYKGHDLVVAALLEAGADASICDSANRAPLHFAAMGNHPGCIRTLSDAGASLNAVDRSGMSPLYLAVGLGSADGVRALIQRGASVSLVCNRVPVLAFACAKKVSASCVHCLLDAGAHTAHVSASMTGALHIAATRANLEAFGILLSRGASVHGSADFVSPVHAIVRSDIVPQGDAADEEECARLLLDCGSSDMFGVFCADIPSLLREAVMKNKRAVVIQLLAYGAFPAAWVPSELLVHACLRAVAMKAALELTVGQERDLEMQVGPTSGPYERLRALKSLPPVPHRVFSLALTRAVHARALSRATEDALRDMEKNLSVLTRYLTALQSEGQEWESGVLAAKCGVRRLKELCLFITIVKKEEEEAELFLMGAKQRFNKAHSMLTAALQNA